VVIAFAFNLLTFVFNGTLSMPVKFHIPDLSSTKR